MTFELASCMSISWSGEKGGIFQNVSWQCQAYLHICYGKGFVYGEGRRERNRRNEMESVSFILQAKEPRFLLYRADALGHLPSPRAPHRSPHPPSLYVGGVQSAPMPCSWVSQVAAPWINTWPRTGQSHLPPTNLKVGPTRPVNPYSKYRVPPQKITHFEWL